MAQKPHNQNYIEADRGGTKYNPGIARHLHTQVEIETIRLLGLTTVNLMTDEPKTDLIVMNDGQLIYVGSID